MRKVIFFDADGTIIKRHFITSKTFDTINQLKSKGHIPVLCTGRTKAELNVLEELKVSDMILAAGSTVLINRQKVYDQVIAEKDVELIIDDLNQAGIIYKIETSEGNYTLPEYLKHFMYDYPIDETSMSQEELRQYHKAIQSFKEITHLIQPDVYQKAKKIQYFVGPEVYGKTIEVNNDVIIERFNDQVHISPMSVNTPREGGEMNPLGINESTGMNIILNHYGLTMADCIAIGDSHNDLEMIQHAGIGIAMGDAVPELKEKADMITTTYEEDGFTQAMQQLNLID